MNWIPHPTKIEGTMVSLVPMEESHLEKLFEAASDKRIWEFYVGDQSLRKTFDKVYNFTLQQREAGTEYPFVIILKGTGEIIGSTRFMDMVRYDNRLEIGGTWLKPEFWKSAVNPDCKLQMLSYCFETLGVKRVQFKTQHDNVRSRKAIEKIGGKFEGIIRKHMLKDDGSYRSSAYYSILDEEWPEVKPKLQALFELKRKQELFR